MKKVFIVAPANLTSGGPELCHQLADTLNREKERAFIVYFPFQPDHTVPAPYQHYNVRPASLRQVEAGSVVVLPEVFAGLTKRFAKTQIYLWWLSVDNFFVIAGGTLAGRLRGPQRAAEAQLRTLRHRVTRHLYQSDYARTFLESVSLGPATRLSDCLTDGFIQAIEHPYGCAREDLIVHNPAKGLRRTELILQALDECTTCAPNVVPIRGLQPEAVRRLLGRAKIYIDFGDHPGKDRIPREAAALGACVIVNRRGSAANCVDVPIDDEFKIDDRVPGFETRAAQTILNLMRDFESQQARFDPYRKAIAQEPAEFLNDVRAAFPSTL
jgi:hypothetical protein